jgi:hypothetical protein
MKPGDHPEFFRFPAPEGRSRESTIRLDGEGRFFHENLLVEHRKLAQAMHTWIARHPDDGRYILTNGYDWTYFTVEDAPFTVRSLTIEKDRVLLHLSDGTEEPFDPASARVGTDGALYVRVKRATKGGPYDAKFTRHAQTELAPLLVDAREGSDAGGRTNAGEGGNAPRLALEIGGKIVQIGSSGG